MVTGDIRCGKLYRYKTWPRIDGYNTYNVCSSSTSKTKQLSPFILGNFQVIDENKNDRLYVRCFENLWQDSKVYAEDIDIHGNIMESWFETRRNGCLDFKAKRKGHRKITKTSSKLPIFSYWNGYKLNYLEARAVIYCPIYEKLVTLTSVFQEFKRAYENGAKLHIIGYDGYDYVKNGQTLRDCFYDTSKPFGHELVLACLLQNYRPWTEHEAYITHKDSIDALINIYR